MKLLKEDSFPKLKFNEAKIMAQDWLRNHSREKFELLENDIITKPYGWIFFYQSKKYLQSGNFSDMLVGNAPILIDRFSGNIEILGTAYTAEQYLKVYEETIPKSRMNFEPEFPPNNK